MLIQVVSSRFFNEVQQTKVESRASSAVQFSTLVEPQTENVIVIVDYEFSYFHSKDFSNFWSEVRF